MYMYIYIHTHTYIQTHTHNIYNTIFKTQKSHNST